MRGITASVIVGALALSSCGGSDSESADATATTELTTTSTTTTSSPETTTTTAAPTTTEATTTTTTSSSTTTTTTTTTTVAPEIGTRDNPIPYGQTADVGSGWSAKVLEVIPDGTQIVQETNQFNDPAPEGFQYVVFDVEVSYNGSEESSNQGVNFGVLGRGSNAIVDRSTMQNYPVPPQPAYDHDIVLYQGGHTNGYVVLEVPVEDIDTMLLIAQPFGDDTRTFLEMSAGTPPSSTPPADGGEEPVEEALFPYFVDVMIENLTDALSGQSVVTSIGPIDYDDAAQLFRVEFSLSLGEEDQRSLAWSTTEIQAGFWADDLVMTAGGRTPSFQITVNDFAYACSYETMRRIESGEISTQADFEEACATEG